MKRNPLIPMGSITGNPSKEQLYAELETYHSVGIDQFLIYPRSGLEVEYMGAEWMEICRHIIEYAAEHNMAIWLYDEYNWPSGKCKGQVIKRNKDFASKKISVYLESRLAEKGMYAWNNNSYFWNVTSIPLYADVLNPDAMDCFIALTHEKYKQRFNKYFGSVIKGFFTDEPSFMYATERHKDPAAAIELPYYDGLENDYRKITGRHFKDDVEGHLRGNTPENLWRDFYQILGNRFNEAFVKKVNSWCCGNNLLFTGHLMHEPIPSTSIASSGNPMQVINSFSMPGIDEIFTNLNKENIEWVTFKQTENAIINNKNGGLAELFAVGPCDMSFEVIRQMIWLNALHGIDNYVLAVSALDARANIEKPDYYNPFCKIQPWFEAFKELGEDAKIAAEFAQKQSEFDLAIRYPQTYTASRIQQKDAKMLPFDLPQLLAELTNRQWQTKLIAEDDKITNVFQAILSIREDGILDEISGKLFADIDVIFEYLESALSRKEVVTNACGEMLEDIIIKTYNDGSICVLSLLDEDRKGLSVKGQKFDLPRRGIFATNKNCFKLPENIFNLPEDTQFHLELLNPNQMRCLFDESGCCKIVVKEELNDIVFNLRNYGVSAKIMLDGDEVSAPASCDNLPPGFKELYMSSTSYCLSKGEHKLQFIGDVKDFMFFPALIITGNFGLFKDNTLSYIPQQTTLKTLKTNGLLNYAGKISLTSKIVIPDNEYISLDSNKLSTGLTLNGQSLGRRLWAPFAWKIPDNIKNQDSEIQIDISTSIRPMFGDYTVK